MNYRDSSKPLRVAIIGGGISGLSAAFYLHKQAPDIDFVLFEFSDRLGGVIQTLPIDNSLVEMGADMFATLVPNDAMQLSRDAGIESILIRPNANHRLARVVSKGQVYPVPNGFSLMQPNKMWSILRSPILSWSGRMRLLKEYLVPPRKDSNDESLESFAIRRLGKEAYDRLVEPIIGGIFTARGSTLSMQAALPQFVEMEKKHGGLIRAARAKRNDDSEISRSAKQASGARYDQFVSHPQGMSAWIQAIADKIPNDRIRTSRKVESLVTIAGPSGRVSTKNSGRDNEMASLNEPTPSENIRWIVTTRNLLDTASSAIEETVFDAVIMACPAKPASELLSPISPLLAEQLGSIHYADSAVVAMLVNRAEVDPTLICFGLVIPQIEGRDSLAISFTSEKYPGRTPPDKILLRVFLGGAVRPELIHESDEQLFDRAWKDVEELLKVKTRPSWHVVVRWPGAMPQYYVGHLDRINAMELELKTLSTLALAGNAYRGVGIPHCVRSGRQAAERIIASLK
jgi:protoporphyrinogen/coproporphyrinogen III oxidase